MFFIMRYRSKQVVFRHGTYFVKLIESTFSVFLSSYRNTRESLGELEKAVETFTCGSFSFSQTSTHVSITTVSYLLNSSHRSRRAS